MPPGSNVYVWTTRPTYTGLRTGGAAASTGPGQVYLKKVGGVMLSVPASQFVRLPAKLVNKAMYKLRVDVDVDILEGDTLLKVTRLNGVTPWPPQLATTVSGNYAWRVRFLDPSPAQILPTRLLYVELERLSGR